MPVWPVWPARSGWNNSSRNSSIFTIWRPMVFSKRSSGAIKSRPDVKRTWNGPGATACRLNELGVKGQGEGATWACKDGCKTSTDLWSQNSITVLETFSVIKGATTLLSMIQRSSSHTAMRPSDGCWIIFQIIYDLNIYIYIYTHWYSRTRLNRHPR